MDLNSGPLKANMVNDIKEYPYSSYHYFLNYKEIPECLKESWIVENYKEDAEAIEAFLTNPVDGSQLQELRKASSLVEAPNIDKRLDMQKLVKMFENIRDIKERNKQIIEAIKQGYSQHRVAKVLGISQPAVYGVIKRNRE